MNAKKPQVEILLKESYLATIKNSVGTKMFQEFYARVGGKKKEVLEKGDKSCAVFVSSVLKLFDLIEDTQLTVHRTLKDMGQSGWEEIAKPRAGCVIVWKEKEFGTGNPRKHLGFYIGNGEAVSNSSKKGYPTKHSYKTYTDRGIDVMYWHPALD